MHGKLYVLLAILFVVVIASANTEQTAKKSNVAPGMKKTIVFKDDNQDKESETAEEDDGENEESTSHDSPFQPYTTNNRGRVRVQLPSPNQQQQVQMTLPMPTTPNSNNGFTCNGLLDPQYPIFSDMCGAVPQARYALPNTFGHNDRWQIAHILTTLMGSTTDAACIRSLRHLLCPMLFQPCRVRHEPPLVLPCQYYCRAVKSQCGIPALDVIPCESLPYASDLCPNLPLGSPFTPSPPAPVATTNQPQAPAPTPSQNPQTARSFPPTEVKPAPQQQVPSPQQQPSQQQQQQPSQQQPTQAPTGQYPYRTFTNDYQLAAKYVPTYLSVKPPGVPEYHAANAARYPTVPFPALQLTKQ